MAKKKKVVSKKKKTEWPLKRKILYRPQRLEYIQGQRKGEYKANACVFCDALAQGISADGQLVYTTPQAMVIMNKYPYNPGHVMVLPKRHEGDIHSLSDIEYEEVMRLVRATIGVLKEAYSVSDFNVGINLGRASGAGIPEHLHIHVVPRWSGDFNFFPLIAETKVMATDPRKIHERLVPLFEKMGREGI